MAGEPRGVYFRSLTGGYGKATVFIVEGPDDAFFLDRMLANLGASPENVGLGYCDGAGKLEQHLREVTLSSAYVRQVTARIVIVRDADEDASTALAEAHSALTANGMPTPAHGKLQSYDDGRSVGVFIIPSGAEPGQLESYLLDSVIDDARLQKARDLLAWVEASYGQVPAKLKKLMQIYLACMPVDCRGPGRAFGLATVFPEDHGRFNELKAFIQSSLA